ncbi:hypothetical protein P7K49_035318 [Saguinus oedipus]|uniref:Ring finger protein 187 n=1 Tax=Saguinus oedipus TaxID=9490 RepID=A0ABQ9TMA3_SAGOE|nr:hypothetical protein P7K49_035318 [Saguinus oedipus]
MSLRTGPRWGTQTFCPTLVTFFYFQENKGSVEIMRKDLNDARDLHGQAESAAARAFPSCSDWLHLNTEARVLSQLEAAGHVMDRRKKALTDYKKLRAFFVEEEEYFLQEAEKEEGLPEDELADPTERFKSLLQAVSELEKKHRNLGLSMLLQVREPAASAPVGSAPGRPGWTQAAASHWGSLPEVKASKPSLTPTALALQG